MPWGGPGRHPERCVSGSQAWLARVHGADDTRRSPGVTVRRPGHAEADGIVVNPGIGMEVAG